MNFTKEQLEEIFFSQYEEIKSIEEKLDNIFQYKYFLNYSLAGDKCNVDTLLDFHRRHGLKIANAIRGHFLPLVAFNINGERDHLHSMAYSDKPIPIRTFRQHWGIHTHGSNVFKIWDNDLDGTSYIFKGHQWERSIYPFCGNNKQPCRSKKGNHCIYRNILDELKLQ